MEKNNAEVWPEPQESCDVCMKRKPITQTCVHHQHFLDDAPSQEGWEELILSIAMEIAGVSASRAKAETAKDAIFWEGRQNEVYEKIKSFIRTQIRAAEERGYEHGYWKENHDLVSDGLNKIQEHEIRKSERARVVAEIREIVKTSMEQIHGGGNGRRILLNILSRIEKEK